MLASFLRTVRRDLRSSELVALLVALTLSVAALSSVSFLADRMQRAFEFDARQLLAADLLLVADQPLPERFIQEAFRLAKCSHPHVIRVDNICQEGPLWCMVMEYVAGGNLRQYAQSKGGLPVAEALRYIQQIT